MIKLFAQYLLSELEEKKPVVKFTSDEYEKKQKKNNAKIKFGKKWFITNYENIYNENKEVFDDLEISGSPEYVYRNFLDKKGKINNEFYNFINQLYINATVPKLIMVLDDD